jgi:hypothetical protein
MRPNLQPGLPTQLANHPIEAWGGKAKDFTLVGPVHGQEQGTWLLPARRDPSLNGLPGLRRQSQPALFRPPFPKDGQCSGLPIHVRKIQSYDLISAQAKSPKLK